MKRVLLVIALLSVFVSGCSYLPMTQGNIDTRTSGSAKGIVIKTNIPKLDIVPVDSFIEPGSIVAGATLKKGTYQPLLRGSDLQSVEWLPNSDDANNPLLSLVWDTKSAGVLDDWSTRNPGKSIALVLDGTVVDTAVVDAPLKSGSIALSGPLITAARSSIDADTVHVR